MGGAIDETVNQFQRCVSMATLQPCAGRETPRRNRARLCKLHANRCTDRKTEK